MRRSLSLCLTALSVLASPTLAQISPEPGFAAGDALDLGADGTYGSLADGTYVFFDGLTFEHRAADGSLIRTLGTLPAFVFPSFLEVHPSQTFALAGESSNGDVLAVDIVNGGVKLLANLPFNFDLAFDNDPDLAYVSAALGGFGTGNDIVRLSISTGATQLVAHLQGPSGPLEVDAGGDLYYVTQDESGTWPPPLDAEDLITWSDDLLDTGLVLDESLATYLLPGLDGGSSLEFDPHSGYLLVANVNFHNLPHEILQVDTDGTLLDTLATASTWISNLEAFDDGGPAILSAYQPTGSLLRVQDTDFAGTLRRRETLEPRRALATFQGPPAGQSGPATVTFEGAEPGAFVSVMFARSADLDPSEHVNDLGWVAPVFTGAPLHRYLRRTHPLATDAQGSFSLTYHQTASTQGAFAFQALVFDPQGMPIGTSTAVVNQ